MIPTVHSPLGTYANETKDDLKAEWEWKGRRDEGRWTREGGEILNIDHVTSIFNEDYGACVERGATCL